MQFDKKLKILNSFPILIFTIVIIIAINGCFFSLNLRQADEFRQYITESAKEQQWEIVRHEILKQYTLATADTKYLSKKIECAILRQYANDMESLKEKFDSGTFDRELFNIFKQELETDSTSMNSITKNESFNYILGFQDSILAIFSDSNKENLSSYKTWAEYFNSSANVQLNETLVSNIINKNLSENLLLYQKGNLDTTTNIITGHTIDALEAIYKSQGLNGLKDIEFVNVAYITEYGDIFGTDDYLYLEKVSNYKMVLVSTANVYDTIKPSVTSELKQHEAETEVILVRLSEDVARNSLGFVTVSLCLLVLIMVFGGFYNKDIQKNDK